MSVKFQMGASTLSTLTKNTSSAGDDLGALVKQLLQAAEPLEGKFQGAGRATFDNFKSNVDGISNELNAALNGVLTGISGMDKSFTEGEQTMIDQTKQTQGAQNFDAARFGSK